MSLNNEYNVCAVAPVHLMEIYRVCVGIAPVIPTLDYVWC